MLNYSKRDHMVTKIDGANKDSEQLFRALNNILGNTNESPLPRGTTDSQLAEDFPDFFLNKIDKIREGFTNIPAYQPRQLDTPELRKFASVTQSQLAKIIKAMRTKTCQLDTIPTDRLKQVLECCLPALTDIKKQIARNKPVLQRMERSTSQTPNKKSISWPRKTNYRLVSNLGFMSKVVEKATLIQFTEYCGENRLLPIYQSAYRKKITVVR